MLLRRSQPERPRPYRIWLYPLPCFLALVGWLFMYCTSGLLFISVGLITLAAGTAVYWLWSPREGGALRQWQVNKGSSGQHSRRQARTTDH